MGYSLDVYTKSLFEKKKNKEEYNREYYQKNCWDGGKFYGYIQEAELEQLDSYKYLLKTGKLDPRFLLFGCSKIEIELTNRQFLHFCKYYLDDLYDYEMSTDKIEKYVEIKREKLKEFRLNKENKILVWEW